MRNSPQKIYYLRNIPPSLHTKWKSIAFALGKDMRTIILEALRIHLEKLNKEIIENSLKSSELFEAVGITSDEGKGGTDGMD